MFCFLYKQIGNRFIVSSPTFLCFYLFFFCGLSDALHHHYVVWRMGVESLLS